MTVQVQFTGNVGRVEEKQWSGKTYVSMSVAVNKGVNKEPMWVETTVWYQDQQAKVKEYGPGDQVMVQGSMTMDEYQSKKDGKVRTALKVRVQNVTRVRKKGESKQESQAGGYTVNTKKYF